MNKSVLIRKIFLYFLVFILMLVPTLKVKAVDGDYFIKINAKAGMKAFTNGRFEAYQIFSGETNDKDKNKLSDIKWGTGIDSNNLVDTLKDDDYLGAYFKNVSKDDSAYQIANILEKNKDDAVFIKLFARCVKENLIGDGISSTLSGANALINVENPGYYIVIDKDDNSQSKENAISGYILAVVGKADVNIKADIPSLEKKILVDDKTVNGTTADIGKTITFRLTGTLANNYDDFGSYYYAFNDTLSDGFTLNSDSIIITIDSKKINDNEYKKTVDSNNIKIEIEDLKKVSGVEITSDSVIVVEYTATLNKNASFNDEANTNSAYLDYSNNTNNSNSKGKTAGHTVYIYTFSLGIEKVDSNSSSLLKDAEFILSKDNLYAIFDKVEGIYIFKEWTTDKSNSTSLISDENGKINIEGLGEGTYILEETKAPVGYVLLKDNVSVQINSTIDEETGELISYNAIVSDNASVKDTEDDTLTIIIPNKVYKVLPSTGGSGTTIYYVLGGILLIGASAYLIFRKKDKK